MSSIDELVIDFYYDFFDGIFTQPFWPKIKERLRRDAVARQVQEAAGAASQALTRFFLSEQLTESEVAEIVQGLRSLQDLITLDVIANPNRTPEALVEELLKAHPCPISVAEAGSAAVYRVSLHLTLQVLMLVGPVMTEWQRLNFSSTYEMPRRIVSQLNQITEGLKAFAGAGQAAVDERYELAYRDHLLQRFYRVEAGTVRMTTNLNVDLRELFVMPLLSVRPKRKSDQEGEPDAETLMNLSAARAAFGESDSPALHDAEPRVQGVPAVEQVRKSPRSVVIGVPGGGKSTFFEWLQLSVANVDEQLVSGGGQAIPLLLRVRQLDTKKLPRGAELIEKATASRDRATLMPEGWIHRQMKAGRILFMLDGLDETDPDIRDDCILPWLAGLCKEYPKCLYLVSSRPVGYPPGTLRRLKFAECDLQDFTELEIAKYTRHWCTAIRLAQNEPDEEARREGAKEGDQIVAGFKGHPYIRNLARNPLMLSAICLVNYFEGGELPKDRAVLYKLCVEGLLHHWDQRRGIHSEYSLDEKLRVCREVAIAMQADDRAEYEAAKILRLFRVILKDKNRAKRLLEHIRYRTGLLIERRGNVFAFAHLTFQEYLAARSVYEGNRLEINAEQLTREHGDGRWNEVIALYCGSASARAVRSMIEGLIAERDTADLSSVLAESFLSSVSDVAKDPILRKRVLERVAIAPVKIGIRYRTQLSRFPDREVKIAANISVGKINSDLTLSESFNWLRDHPKKIVEAQLVEQLKSWRQLNPSQIGELVYLLHRFGTEKMLVMLSPQRALYATQGPEFPREVYVTQAEIALLALSERNRGAKLGLGSDRALLQSFRAIVENKAIPETFAIRTVFDPQGGLQGYKNRSNWPELRLLATQLADRIENAAGGQGKGSKSKRLKVSGPELRRTAGVIRNWISKIEGSIKEDKTRGLKGKSVSISRGKRIAKKSTQRRTRS